MKSQPQMRSLLQRIATGPELSKDISMEEARLGMELILRERVDPVEAGLFLIALRMKRETDDELLGVQAALLGETRAVTAEIDDLVEISDPFNGYERGLPVSPFIPVVLAACGVPAISHGAELVGPKYGVTHQVVLAAAGAKTGLTMEQVISRVSDPKIGWANVDQRFSCPGLHRLLELRDLMVKRTCLTTLEVALKPVSAKQHTHLVTGFVHKPYPPIYAMLAKNAGYQSAMIVRGVEGGVIPSLQQPSRVFSYFWDKPEQELRIEPTMVGLSDAPSRALPIPAELAPGEEGGRRSNVAAIAAAAADKGIEALNGKQGLAYDSLVYAGALVLAHIGHGTIEECALKIRDVLDNGAALRKLV